MRDLHSSKTKTGQKKQKRNGFTTVELMVGITTGTLIIGAASMALRSTQTLISESEGKATLRQNTPNGLRLMRSEIERSMLAAGEDDADVRPSGNAKYGSLESFP